MSKDYFMQSGKTQYRTIGCDEYPAINVINKNDFLSRASTVFKTYNDVLKKTLGAYGSPTIITNYPYKDVTKDGYTVCRNIEFDREESSDLDKVIGGMISDICAKLNYAVGDGTTSAIVATNKIFQELFGNSIATQYGVEIGGKRIRPKDFMEIFNNIKDEIVAELEKKAIHITDDNLVDIINKIVTISTNGDKEIIDGITKAYEEIGFPAIVCEKSENHKTYCEITNGYQAKCILADKIYINNDNRTATYQDADVIIFGVKVTAKDYEKIIKPINEVSKACHRKLLCLAPWYDEVLLNGTIKRDLLNEYEREHEINLVICNYFSSSKAALQRIQDLAVILGTNVIDRTLELDLIDKSNDLEGRFIDVINCFDRGIDNILIAPNLESNHLVKCKDGQIDEDRKKGTIFNLGFTDYADISMTSSVFRNTHYDEGLYKLSVEDAKNSYADAIEKFKELGTYTKEVYDSQARYCSLRMKMATLYVGGVSDLSGNMYKDAADDAIRAADSAFQFGYIKGGNLTIIEIVNEMLNNANDPVREYILKAIGNGFMDVYYEVLFNAFPTDRINHLGEDAITRKDMVCDVEKVVDVFVSNGIKIPRDKIKTYLNDIIDNPNAIKIGDTTKDEFDIAELLVYFSLLEGKVFDLSIMDFSDNVINSMKTDAEILTATTELLSIMAVGNQVVMGSWNHNKLGY